MDEAQFEKWRELVAEAKEAFATDWRYAEHIALDAVDPKHARSRLSVARADR